MDTAYFGSERPFDQNWELTVYASSITEHHLDGEDPDYPANANWLLRIRLDAAGSE